jgi:hypothetical protein
MIRYGFIPRARDPFPGSIPASGGFPTLGERGGRMERIVRSFVDIDSQPINRIFRRPDPTPETPETLITWGASSQFVFPPQVTSAGTPGSGAISYNWPTYNYNNGEEDPVLEERYWTEVSRITSPKRVENPEDAEQYVIIDRIDEMVMVDSKDGESITLVFRNPP